MSLRERAVGEEELNKADVPVGLRTSQQGQVQGQAEGEDRRVGVQW